MSLACRQALSEEYAQVGKGCLRMPPSRHPEPGVQVGEGSQALGSSDAR